MHFLVYEYVEGQDLFSFIEQRDFQPLNEEFVKKIFSQLVNTLDYLHQLGICHRDLKMENVMIDRSGKLFLIDFDLCSFCSPNELCKTYCGTPAYAPAEIVAKSPYSPFLADVYSLGVLLYSMLYAHYPFNLLDRFQALVSHQKEHPQLKFDDKLASKHISDSVKNLLKKMLINNPSKRITISEIKKHEWLQNYSFFRNENPKMLN